ncbi:MAG: YolD-like family protein [Bacilli bacterium]|nr:YolD-like family protein [Bacilli bacterium]
MNEDILYLNRPVSKYPKMNIQDRASIFSPFAALTGYEDAIKETGKLLDKKVELDENEIEIINYKLQNIKNKEISIKYFVKDNFKEGGYYKNITCFVKKIDNINKIIILKNNKKIKFDDIIEID